MSRVTLAACLKNEGPYILEWVAHHKLVGFDRIEIYDNGSTDEGGRILAGLAAAGEIVLRRQPDRKLRGPQFNAYVDAVRRCRTEWIMFLDLDEFLVLKQAPTIGAFLAPLAADVAQVGFNWRCFGSAGLATRGEGLVIERFRLSGRRVDTVNRHVKSVTRAARIIRIDLHAPRIDGGRIIHPDGRPLAMDHGHGRSAIIHHQTASVHHYAVKSREEFDAKIARGRGAVAAGKPKKFRPDPAALFASLDLNARACDDLAVRAPEVRAEMARLATALAAVETTWTGRLRRLWASAKPARPQLPFGRRLFGSSGLPEQRGEGR